MVLNLTEPEARVLMELLESDISHLLMEIARTDRRRFRKDLGTREELLKDILRKLREGSLEAA
jgi:phosphoribosylamine-glycine ligase